MGHFGPVVRRPVEKNFRHDLLINASVAGIIWRALEIMKSSFQEGTCEVNSLLLKVSIATVLLISWFGEPIAAAERDPYARTSSTSSPTTSAGRTSASTAPTSRRRTSTSSPQSGARLEQFYAQPMCTPTRAALMTGRYPFRYGLQTAVIPSGQHLRPGDRRVAAAAGAEGGGLRDRDHRQVAPRPRRPQVLAAAARLRLPVRAADRRDRLLHPRAARRAGLVSQQQAREGRGLLDAACSATTRSSSSTSTTRKSRSSST